MTIHPPDAAVAARSFPRRWRALFASAAGDGDGDGDVLLRSGALDLARQAADTMAATAGRLTNRPPVTLGRGEAFDELDRGAESLALSIDQVNPDDWTPERVEAMSTGIDEVAALLRKAEAAIRAARADRGG